MGPGMQTSWAVAGEGPHPVAASAGLRATTPVCIK